MNKIFKKGLTVSATAAMGMSIVLPTVSVIAAPAVTNGWVKVNGTWYYYYNGTMVKNGWAKDSHGWGYIRDGYWVDHATWAKDSQGWQFIGANGYWNSSVAAKAENPITKAAEAVAKAEESTLQADIDAAKTLINDLDSSLTEKTDLTNKLTAVETQKSADDAIAAASEVNTLIAALPEAGTVTLENQTEIEAARAAYDALTDAQKELVTNIPALETAEAELAAL